MTRINAGVNVKALSDEHLLAEHRGLVRIPNAVSSGKAKLNDIPQAFTLGQGHVKFFYNKLGYLKSRYTKIHAECLSRGFCVQDFSASFSKVKLGKWSPSSKDTSLVISRICSNVLKSPKQTYHFSHQPVSASTYLSALRSCQA